MAQAPSLLSQAEAFWNAAALCQVVGALYAINQGKQRLHRGLMMGAIAASFLFLVFYVIRHYVEGTVHFTGPDAIRPFYLFILSTHTVLAAVALPIVLRTAYLGVKGNHPKHRRIARITVPVWLYTSITGIAIFGMIYGLD
ncbi:MAG: hypothetical protein CME06_07915 [Gemmatimonadetes bacterium]|nr:hypothetical protein [Gemmatimonadota bacterium]